MKTKIFLPSEEEARKLIENAVDEFTQQLRREWKTYDTLSDANKGLLRDMFVAGYAAGHNDCLSIIRGQLEATEIMVRGNESAN